MPNPLNIQREFHVQWLGTERPRLFWRRSEQAHFQNLPFQDGAVRLEASAREQILFYVTDGQLRWPARGCYKSRSRLTFVQADAVFAYRPAAQVTGPRRDYLPEAPREFESHVLGEKRKVRVYLPRGYHQHVDRSYPVLYLQDGQNIFERGAFGSWAAHHKLDRLIERGEIEELIVVAADHGVGRYEDYVPPEDGGRAHRYAEFLVSELKPWIDSSYRTRTGPQDTAVMGSSLGGLAAFYVAWTYPQVVGKVASLSGSWWLRRWRDQLPQSAKRPLRCYLDSGDSGPANDCVQHTRALRQILLGLGFALGEDLQHRVAQKQTHTEAAWGQRLVHALRFLFPLTDAA